MNKWKPRSGCLRHTAHSFKVVPRAGSHPLGPPRRPWGRSAGSGHYFIGNPEEDHSGQGCGLTSEIRKVIRRGTGAARSGGPSAGPARCGTDNPGAEGATRLGTTVAEREGLKIPHSGGIFLRSQSCL